ncbi:MAG: transglutaminase family protein [Nitrospinae bacterium]|nr:transglutaminase family protein [Nitrospinota bacterium]
MSVPKDNNQISHLIRLLDDRDEFVRGKVRDQLIQIGEDALPFLEMATRTENPSLRAIAGGIIQAIYPKQLGEKFRQLALSARGSDLNLEKGIILLMEFGHPQSKPEDITVPLDQIAAKLRSRLDPDDAPEQAVQALTRFLFIEQGFAGNESNYLDPDNSYFNKVLQRRTGIPITLSALCLLVAERLNLPIVGVGLPGHYIVKYASLTDPIFFDPFHKGRILQREDCIQLVNSTGFKFEEYHLSQSTHRETLVRMINNLVAAYGQTGKLEKAQQLKEYIGILLNSPQSFSAKSP